MGNVQHPAFKAFVERLGAELSLAQVLVRRVGSGFELRHIIDSDASAEVLREVEVEELRALAQFTGSGTYRPLKAAPNLRTGWRCIVENEPQLERAMEHLYPGAVVDWFAAQSAHPPVTNYRAYTGRQSGMYRITAKLDDEQAAAMIRACCDRQFCLKRRLWTVEGLHPESSLAEVEIPCLEPCAVLLEFARKAMRIEQEEGKRLDLKPSDTASLLAAAEIALKHPAPELREADFGAAANPRRIRLALEKLRARSGKPD